MGLFNSEKHVPLNYTQVKPHLVSKDGKIHTVLLTDVDKDYSTNHIRPYSDMLNEIISCMQDEQYEIIDIKQNLGFGPFHTGSSDFLTFNTLIIYK